ncbi:MAG: CBS domain-containing protein [Thaumarchaeota archaeon]|nr:CBS domain-containing protein [Nitrososphaerota archaeon]
MAKVSDFMTREVITIESHSSVLQAAEKIAARRVGGLAVTAKGIPVGVVTERDLVVKVLAQKKDPQSTKIAEVMSTPPIVVAPGSSLREAAKIMVDKNIRRLLVVNNGSLVGIVTIRDVTRSIVNAMANYEKKEDVGKEAGLVIDFET